MKNISSNVLYIYDTIIEGCRKKNKETIENLVKSLITISVNLIRTPEKLPSLFIIALKYLEKNYFKDIQSIFERLKKNQIIFQPFHKPENIESKNFGNKIWKFSKGYYKIYTENKNIAKKISNLDNNVLKTKYKIINNKYGYELIIPESLYYRAMLIIYEPPYMNFLESKRTGQLKIDFV
ncbi:hypothetical protein DRQ09_08295 [candidate division KSB1 bacterium]|nr:MAG: hypothetical protein DRQ09_08295 [candidate division KSB1 bacterium]